MGPQALHDYQDQLLILDAVVDAVLAQGPDGRVTYANEGACRLLGAPDVDSVVGATLEHLLTNFVLQDDAGRPLSAGDLPSSIALSGMDAPDLTLSLATAETERWLVASATPVRDERHDLRFVVSVLRDVTSLKKAEADNRRLFEEEQAARAQAEATARRLSAIQRVTDAALSHLAEAELLDELLARIDEILDVDVAAILLVTDDDTHLAVRSALGYDDSVDLSPLVPIGRGVTGRVAQMSGPLAVEDLTTEEIISPTLKDRGVRSFLGVPLIAEGRTLGVLHVATVDQRSFSDADAALLQVVGDRAASAIDRARTFASEREARRAAERNANRLLRLQTVTAALSRTMTRKQVAQVVIEEGFTSVGAMAGSIVLLDADRSELRVQAHFGYPQELMQRWGTFPLTREIPLAHAVIDKAPVTISSPEERDRRYPRLSGSNSGGQALAALPLIVEETAIGAVGLSFETPREFDQGDVQFMMLIAQQCAQALERARLYETERRARRAAEAAQERLAFLATATEILAESLDYRRSLQKLAQLLVPKLADWCVIHVLEGTDAIHPLAVAHVDPAKVEFAFKLQEQYPPDPHRQAGPPQVIRSGQAELYPEVPQKLLEMSAQDEEHLRILRGLGLRSMMIVPLTARGRTFGSITFISSSDERIYGSDDLVFAQEVARRGGVAIDNARLYQERAHIAQTLQRSLLPPELPDIPGVEVAARYRPAGEGNEVGGDFYDVFSNKDDTWALVIGDVCGKGPRAAALTGLARHTVRTAAMREESPTAVLQVLNSAVARESTDNQFCTVVYATLSPGDDAVDLDIVCGGHPLPYIIRSDGAVEPAGRPGTVLGIMEDPDLVSVPAALAPGDALVLFTDGVTDETRGNEVFGEARLVSLLGTCAGLSAGEIAERIEIAVDGFRSGAPRDDIAILVLRATTSPNETA